MAYTTSVELKSYLGISAADEDALLTALIARAQAVIDGYCQRAFEASADTTRYFGPAAINGRDLWLDHDLCAVTGVINGDGVAVASDDYTTRPRNDKPWYALRLTGAANVAWTADDDEIIVTGKWAYTESAPTDIVHATIRLAAWLYRQKDNHEDLDRALVVGNATILPSRLPDDIKTILHPYRRLAP